MVQVDLITGFLGAGKTTFLRRYVRYLVQQGHKAVSYTHLITQLNRELVTNSTKFLRIMDMASVEIGGCELRTDTGSVFVTDNFFSLLGMPEMQGEQLSVRRFEEVLKSIREKNPSDRTAEGDELLTIQQPDGVRYIMLRSTIEGHAKIGLAEDVTAAVLERKRIEHERDHDIDVYKRQAQQHAARVHGLGGQQVLCLRRKRFRQKGVHNGNDAAQLIPPVQRVVPQDIEKLVHIKDAAGLHHHTVKAAHGHGAEFGAVSYTHLDVYKRQDRSGTARR